MSPAYANKPFMRVQIQNASMLFILIF